MATFLVILSNLCTGPATPGTAYLDCVPTVGELAYCPGNELDEADCVVTHVSVLRGGRSIVRWEPLTDARSIYEGGAL